MTAISYVPIVKGHQYDLQALARTRGARVSMKPLVEYTIPKEDADPHEALLAFIDRFQRHLGMGEVFLDFYGLREEIGSILRKHPVAAGYEMLKARQRAVTPVVGFDRRDPSLWDDLRPWVAAFARGFCFRVDIEDLDGSPDDIWQQVIERTAQLKLASRQVDVLIDLRYVGDLDVVALREVVTDFVTAANGFAPRSFIVSGSSALETVAEVPRNHRAAVNRRELRLWADLYTDLVLSTPLIFSDYGVVYPDFNRHGSSEHINAKLRYTAGNCTHYFRGGPLRQEPGYDQYRDLADQVTSNAFYMGRAYSYGDKYVHDCARGFAQPSVPGDLVLCDQNHHFEYTAAQAARLVVELTDATSPDDVDALIEQL